MRAVGVAFEGVRRLCAGGDLSSCPWGIADSRAQLRALWECKAGSISTRNLLFVYIYRSSSRQRQT